MRTNRVLIEVVDQPSENLPIGQSGPPFFLKFAYGRIYPNSHNLSRFNIAEKRNRMSEDIRRKIYRVLSVRSVNRPANGNEKSFEIGHARLHRRPAAIHRKRRPGDV